MVVKKIILYACVSYNSVVLIISVDYDIIDVVSIKLSLELIVLEAKHQRRKLQKWDKGDCVDPKKEAVLSVWLCPKCRCSTINIRVYSFGYPISIRMLMDSDRSTSELLSLHRCLQLSHGARNNDNIEVSSHRHFETVRWIFVNSDGKHYVLPLWRWKRSIVFLQLHWEIWVCVMHVYVKTWMCAKHQHAENIIWVET